MGGWVGGGERERERESTVLTPTQSDGQEKMKREGGRKREGSVCWE